MKRFFCLILSVICMAICVWGNNVPVFDVQNENVQLTMWFEDDNGTVSCRSALFVPSTTFSAEVSIYEDGILIERWPLDNSIPYFMLTETFACERGKTYVAMIHARVTLNGETEPIVKAVTRRYE